MVTNTDPTIDASVMHETACLVQNIQLDQSQMALSLPLWASSSGLGFQPATISAAGYLVLKGGWNGKLPAVAKLENAFRTLVRAGNDPNVIAVEAMRLFLQNKTIQASVLFKQALDRGGTDFSFFQACHFYLGKIATLQGKRDAAIKHLENSIFGLRPPSENELGKLYALADRPQEAEQHFYNAAMLGIDTAWSRLAELDLARSLDESDGERKEHYQLRAAEWHRLSNHFKKSPRL